MRLLNKVEGEEDEMVISAQGQEIAQIQLAIQYAIKHEKAEFTWMRAVLKLYDDFEEIRAGITIHDDDL